MSESKITTDHLDLGTIISKTQAYKKILKNTMSYRKAWHTDLKPMIIETLNHINDQAQLEAKIHVRDNIENMEAIVLDMGRVHSGMSELLEDSDVKKTIVKTQGGIVYQQLFNGKVLVIIVYPFIEGYGQPRPPKNVEILRPHELKQPFILRHVEEMLTELTHWEDYDDDQPAKAVIGFSSPVGFKKEEDENEDELPSIISGED